MYTYLSLSLTVDLLWVEEWLLHTHVIFKHHNTDPGRTQLNSASTCGVEKASSAMLLITVERKITD